MLRVGERAPEAASRGNGTHEGQDHGGREKLQRRQRPFVARHCKVSRNDTNQKCEIHRPEGPLLETPVLLCPGLVARALQASNWVRARRPMHGGHALQLPLTCSIRSIRGVKAEAHGDEEPGDDDVADPKHRPRPRVVLRGENYFRWALELHGSLDDGLRAKEPMSVVGTKRHKQEQRCGEAARSDPADCLYGDSGGEDVL
mmetsp:Transcript_101358/g.285909  ORF Transcript_101358/g.285909 Transcript_101358/m.285909 type:complete len:201 (-) Transcript_101358:589-1191(-)